MFNIIQYVLFAKHSTGITVFPLPSCDDTKDAYNVVFVKKKSVYCTV